MNLKKLSRGILAIGVAFAIVVVPNTARFANAANTPSVEVNDKLTPVDHYESQHFWTEKDDHTGTKTKVQVTVTNHGTRDVGYFIQEDVKGLEDWYWNLDKNEWKFSARLPGAGPFATGVFISPGETQTVTVTTNTDQGLIKGHVRGVYVRAEFMPFNPFVGDLSVNMKKVD
ncbi:MAG: hypothetical protein LBI63_04915 [Candidatus Ancillula sp.]|jgi:hypothetical protein|nr:hypothetical protein [Candidatus Ancillula sp.]